MRKSSQIRKPYDYTFMPYASLLCSVYPWVELESFPDFRAVVLSAFAVFREAFPLAEPALHCVHSLFARA